MLYYKKIPKVVSNGPIPEGVEDQALSFLSYLEKIRLSENLPLVSRITIINGSIVKGYVTESISKAIVLIRSLANPHILLFNNTEFHAYEYYKDKVTKALNYEGAGVLSPIYDGRSQLADIHYATYDRRWSQGDASGLTLTFLGGMNAYEMGLFASGNDIYGRIGETIGELSTVPDTFLPQFAKPNGSLFSLPSYEILAPWNLYQGVKQHTISPATKVINESWRWVPSFFTVYPGETYTSSFDTQFAGNWAQLQDITFSGTSSGLQPGFYYGQKNGGPKYFHGDPLESMKVSFKGLLDTRYTSYVGDYQYGWAEIVKEADGVPLADIYFYFQPTRLTVMGNTTWYRELVTGSYNTSIITIGSWLDGFSASTFISLDPNLYPDPDVEMWNFKIWTNPDALLPQQDTGVCIAIISGSHATFTRFSGYEVEVFTTERYHSFSTSRDGTILAVFEETNGLISDVNVFDLYGTREVKVDSEHTSGGFTVLRQSTIVASVEAVTANVIPYREEGYTPQVPSVGLTDPPSVPNIIPYTDYMPCLAMMRFIKNATGGLTISKIFCDNGVDAEFGSHYDECFGSTIIVDDPDTQLERDKLVSVWEEGNAFKGVVRGDFSGVPSNVTFQGIGTGSSGWYGVMKLNHTLSVSFDAFGLVLIGGVAGELSTTSCTVEVDGQLYVDMECRRDCQDYITVAASSTCGQNGSGKFLVESNALYVSGEEDINVGDFYTAGGGSGLYTYSFDSGSIDSKTGEIYSIDACPNPGASRAGIITVSDGCTTAQFEGRLPGGTWVITSQNKPINPSTEFYWHFRTRKATGGSRVTHYYNRAVDPGWEYWPEQYYYSGHCFDWNPPADVGSGGYLWCNTTNCGPNGTATTPLMTSHPDYLDRYSFNDYPCTPSYASSAPDRWYRYQYDAQFYINESWVCP